MNEKTKDVPFFMNYYYQMIINNTNFYFFIIINFKGVEMKCMGACAPFKGV